MAEAKWKLTCKKEACRYTWLSCQRETVCPACSERKDAGKRRQFIETLQRREQSARARGEVTNDLESICDSTEGGCGHPLRGYCAYEVREDGQQVLACECGHETLIFDRDRFSEQRYGVERYT